MADWKKLFSLRKTAKEEPGVGWRTSFSYGTGISVSEETAMKVSAYYRGVIYISTQIAKLPWDVKNKNYEILEDDTVSILLNVAPNSEMNAFNFKLAMIQTAINVGNAYAEIERDMIGRPIALWPITGHTIYPWRDPQTGILWYRASSTNASAASADVFLEPRDVFHVKNFHTKNGLTGLGLVEYARETLGIAQGGDRMASGLFANSGLPSGVLTSESKMSDEAYDRLQTSWREQYSGAKAGGVAILEEGFKFEALNMDPEVLQFLESRKFGVLEIARFLGLPPTKLFDTSGATFSNVENANLEVATDTLDAWAVNLELEADVKLLSKRFGGKFTELDLYSVFRGDMTTRSNYFSKMMQTGAITPNQIRRREGLPGYGPNGDRYFVATNNFTPADRIDEVIDAQVAPKTVANPNSNDDAPKETEADKELKIAALQYLAKSK